MPYLYLVGGEGKMSTLVASGEEGGEVQFVWIPRAKPKLSECEGCHMRADSWPSRRDFDEHRSICEKTGDKYFLVEISGKRSEDR